MAIDFRKWVKGILVQNESDKTKEVRLTIDNSASSGTNTTLVAKQTANRSLDLPDVSGTLVEIAAAQTLTNKIIDGDVNTVQDLALSSLKTVLGDATKFIARDVSGQVVSTNVVPSGLVVGNTDTQTLTNKTIDADSNTITNIDNSDIKAAANIALTKLAAVTVSRVIESNGSGVLSPSTVTSTELQLLSGVTGTLTTNTGTQTLTNKTINADNNTIINIDNNEIKAAAGINVNKLEALTVSRAVQTDGTGFISPSTTTSTELGYVSGVTSALQTQLDGKQSRSTLTTKGDLYVATASATTARQAVGTDGQVLTSDSSQTNGIRWATAATAPDSSYEVSNLTLLCSVASNALTIAVKTKAGTDASGGDPIKIGTRSSTLTSGVYNQRTISSALSFVVSSGSTLGHSSANSHNIWVYLIDNAGTLELAVSQTLFPETELITTTAEGGAGAADSNRVVYSSVARTNVPFRVIGKLTSTQTTAGTWAVVPTAVSVGTRATLGLDRIYARYTSSAGQSIATGAQPIIDFGTKVTDTHGTVTTGVTWKFTAPISGNYLVTTLVSFVTTTFGAGNGTNIALVKNNATYSRISQETVHATNTLSAFSNKGSDAIYLNAGDFIDLRIAHGESTSRSLSADTERVRVSIDKIND